MTVPSNLIPVAITGLPLDPAPSDQGFMAYTRAGTTYKVQVADILSYSGVPTTRQVLAGTGLTGGGQLTGNVTLSVAPSGIGPTQLADTGVAAGTYGDSTTAVTVTVDAQGRITAISTASIAVSGYVPTSRQIIAGDGLTGGGALSSNVTVSVDFAATTPESVNTTGSAGVATTVSRSDHKHPAIDLADDDQVDGLLGLGNGGTARSLVANAGAIVWSGADGLYIGSAGNAGQVLVSAGTSGYSWGTAVLVSDQAANLIFAGPAAGPDAPVTFRAMVNADLPASGVTANTYGSATAIPVIVVNSKGVITGVTTQNVVGGVSSVNGQTGVVVLTASDVGAPATNGTGASGTWGISISGTAATATNVAGGAANQIVYNTGSNTSAFITAPTVANTYLEWSGSAFQWSANPLGTVTSVGGTGTVSGISLSGTVTSSGNLTLGGALDLSAPPVIGGATPNTATFTTANATTFDTNVAAAGVTLSGTTLAADGTDTDITIQINPKGGGGVGIGGDTNGVVAGVPVTSKFCVKNDGDAPLAGFVHANNTTAGSGAATFACRSRGTIASPTAVQSDDTLWNMFVAGHDGTDLALAATISVQVDGTPGSNDMPARMVFSTTPDGSQIPAEAMRITSAQVVQIGTADINGGNIDGTTIGASVAAAVTGTTITASTQFSGAGTGLTGTGSSFTAGAATNLAGGAASQIPYQSGAGTTVFLANGTAGQVLLSNGASAPSWAGISGGTF
jgi:hypothetical protein